MEVVPHQHHGHDIHQCQRFLGYAKNRNKPNFSGPNFSLHIFSDADFLYTSSLRHRSDPQRAPALSSSPPFLALPSLSLPSSLYYCPTSLLYLEASQQIIFSPPLLNFFLEIRCGIFLLQEILIMFHQFVQN